MNHQISLDRLRLAIRHGIAVHSSLLGGWLMEKPGTRRRAPCARAGASLGQAPRTKCRWAT